MEILVSTIATTKLLLSNHSEFMLGPQNLASTSLGIPQHTELSMPRYFAIFKSGNGMFVELPLQEEMVTSKHSSKETEIDTIVKFLPLMPSNRAKSLLPLL